MTAPDGLVVVDKPAEWTSHDVVARVRRLAATRRVGHAGTLDPMATGVLVLGVGKATRLLGHLALTEKEYVATIRLGSSTTTDDAEGEVIATVDASGVPDARLAAGMLRLTGDIEQVPSSVSAIKVGGVRAYTKVRKGEDVELAARRVTVGVFELLARRGVDLDVRVVCSSGTYVRALARDLGAALGVGAHLTALRRTRVGPYTLDDARTLEQLEQRLDVLPLAEAARCAFPVREVGDDEAILVSHGGRLPATGAATGPVAVFAPDGSLLALVEERDGAARPLAVFVG